MREGVSRAEQARVRALLQEATMAPPCMGGDDAAAQSQAQCTGDHAAIEATRSSTEGGSAYPFLALPASWGEQEDTAGDEVRGGTFHIKH